VTLFVYINILIDVSYVCLLNNKITSQNTARYSQNDCDYQADFGPYGDRFVDDYIIC